MRKIRFDCKQPKIKRDKNNLKCDSIRLRKQCFLNEKTIGNPLGLPSPLAAPHHNLNLEQLANHEYFATNKFQSLEKKKGKIHGSHDPAIRF